MPSKMVYKFHKRWLVHSALRADSVDMTFLCILCIWTVGGLPLGILVGSMIAKANADVALLPELELDMDMDMGLEMPVCS